MEWTQCPQCGLVAEVVDRDVWPSTDGPIEHLHVRCVARHRFVLPAATLELHHAAAAGQSAEAAPAATGRELQRREPAGRELVPVRVRRRGEPPR
jgi:hypothetical protein